MSLETSPAAPYDVALEANRIGFFETPIVFARFKNPEPLARDLAAMIRRRMAETPGFMRSNVGGWHSETDMLAWGWPAARAVADQAIAVAKRLTHFEGYPDGATGWRVQMWANVSGRGAYNEMHAHPGNLWSAVFYVDPGVGDQAPEAVGGAFFFEDPRFPLNVMHTPGFRMRGPDGAPQALQPEVRPRAGDLIVFPAWLRHGVRPYTGDAERISIAINLDPTFA